MLSLLKRLVRPPEPEPAGPPRSVARFAPPEVPIAAAGLRVEDGVWRIDAADGLTVRLFEVPLAEEACMLTYRAEIRAESVAGRAYLEMWCRLPGRGEFFSKGFHHALRGSAGWASYETPFYLKPGQRSDLVKLNLVVEGSGTLWIKDVELLATPLRS